MSHRGALSLSVPQQQGRQRGSRYPAVECHGREEVGNTKEEEAVVTSELKQDRERWETWKMSLEKLLASCIQETQPREIRYIPHPNTNHLYQPT